MKMNMISALFGALLPLVSILVGSPPTASSQPESIATPVVALVSDEPEVTAQTLAKRFREMINSVGGDELRVQSEQRVSFLALPLNSGEEPDRDISRAFGLNSLRRNPVESVVVDITADSRMRENYIHSGLSRSDVEHTITILEADTDTCSVDFYYPNLDETNRVKISTSDLGEDVLFDYITERMDDPLLAEIDAGCATVEFWSTWPGDFIDTWEFVISSGELEGLDWYNGNEVYKVRKEFLNESFGSRVELYFIDRETGLLIGYQNFMSYFTEGVACYLSIDASYEYTFPEGKDLVVSSSEVHE